MIFQNYTKFSSESGLIKIYPLILAMNSHGYKCCEVLSCLSHGWRRAGAPRERRRGDGKKRFTSPNHSRDGILWKIIKEFFRIRPDFIPNLIILLLDLAMRK